MSYQTLTLLLFVVVFKTVYNFQETHPYTTPSEEVGKLLEEFDTSTDRRYLFEIGHGFYYQGDILVAPDVYESSIENLLASGVSSKVKWTNGVVPYEITGKFSHLQHNVIQKAIKQFSDKTCVRFVPRTTEKLYLTIENTPTGCWAYVGMHSQNVYNTINLQAPACLFDVGTAIHEIMHTLGFEHEHVRSDRDSYLFINRTALAPQHQDDDSFNQMFMKLGKKDSEKYGLPYDYGSVMHYSKWGGAASWKYPVLKNKGNWKGDFGNDMELSEQDVILINKVYCSNRALVYLKVT